MRPTPILFSLILPLLAACGGGSGDGSTPTSPTASLTGAVVELDGQTVDRSGVRVRVVETGQTEVTGTDGRFAFAGVPAGDFTLSFDTTAAARLAQESESESESETESENESAEDLDEDTKDELEDERDDVGEPRLFDVEDNDEVEVRVVLNGDEIVEFKRRSDGRLEARMRLVRASGASDPDVEGKVKIRSEADGDEFEIEAEHLAPGTAVEFFLDDPDTDAEGFVSIGVVSADAEGEAELERDTGDGESLPLGVSSVADLEDFAIEVRLASTGEVLLTGTVPALPTSLSPPGTEPLPGEEAEGKARLVPQGFDLEGSVEIETEDEGRSDEFEMEAERLVPGQVVTFQIADPDAPGTFVDLITLAAGDDGEAEYETEDGDPLPLDVQSVRELVGLEVRVVDSQGTVLLSGTVPALVVD